RIAAGSSRTGRRGRLPVWLGSAGAKEGFSELIKTLPTSETPGRAAGGPVLFWLAGDSLSRPDRGSPGGFFREARLLAIDNYPKLFSILGTLEKKTPEARETMEKQDLELIVRLSEQDPELKKFWDEHHEYERLLDAFNRRPYLTTAETLERKRLQKLKLAGRDRMEQILAKYRGKERMS